MKNCFILLLILGAKLLSAQCMLNAMPASANDNSAKYKQYESSGDANLDAFFIAQLRLAMVVFSISEVDLYFYDDSRSPNAVAVPVPGLDMVSFGLTIIEKKRTEFIQRPDQACAALIAHEMAHIKQFERGGLSNLSNFQEELHADFLAGYYMGYKWRIELATEVEAETFFDMFKSLGDTAFGSLTHHGTPEQRKRAAMAGWRLGKEMVAINKVYDEGAHIVSKYLINDGDPRD